MKRTGSAANASAVSNGERCALSGCGMPDFASLPEDLAFGAADLADEYGFACQSLSVLCGGALGLGGCVSQDVHLFGGDVAGGHTFRECWNV